MIAFHCSTSASLYEIALSDHAVLQGIVKPPKKKRNVINFKNFFESHRPQITELFAEFGVEPQFLYSNSTVEELEHLSESLATVCICGTLGTYLGNGIEEKFGVPYVRTINPMVVSGCTSEIIGDDIGKIAEEENEQFVIPTPLTQERLEEILFEYGLFDNA